MVRRTVKYTKVWYCAVSIDENGNVTNDKKEDPIFFKGHLSKDEIKKMLSTLPIEATLLVTKTEYVEELREMSVSDFIKNSKVVEEY